MSKPARDVLVVMDPIESIKIAKDSSFAMLLEAQQRHYRLFYVTPGALTMHGGTASAEVSPLTVRDDQNDWFETGPASHRALGSDRKSVV